MEMVSPVAARASIENVKRSAPLDGRLGSLYVIPSSPAASKWRRSPLR